MTDPDVAIFAALKGLVANRCYPDAFPQPETVRTYPAIRYQEIAREPEPDLCGTDDGETDRTHMQIDYVAKTKGAAKVLRASGRVALAAITDPPCIREGGFTTHDAQTDTFRCVDEYSFHPSSS